MFQVIVCMQAQQAFFLVGSHHKIEEMCVITILCSHSCACFRHVATQFPVAVEFGTHKLKTHVDMIGYKDDKLVVIELKCTQHSLDVHEKLYPLPCGAGKLSNHLPDTEKIHHQLQTAFGVIGLQERVGPKYKVIGRIVVCTEDAVRSYPCDAVFVRKSLFAVYPWESKKIAKVNNSIKLLSLPSEKSAQKIIVDEISQQLKGFTNVVEDAKCGVSFVLSNPRSKKKAAIALLNDPQNMGTTGAKYKKTRLHVLAAAKKNDMMPVVVTKSPEGYIVRRIKRM